jgi:hypothetical protein
VQGQRRDIRCYIVNIELRARISLLAFPILKHALGLLDRLLPNQRIALFRECGRDDLAVAFPVLALGGEHADAEDIHDCVDVDGFEEVGFVGCHLGVYFGVGAVEVECAGADDEENVADLVLEVS